MGDPALLKHFAMHGFCRVVLMFLNPFASTFSSVRWVGGGACTGSAPTLWAAAALDQCETVHLQFLLLGAAKVERIRCKAASSVTRYQVPKANCAQMCTLCRPWLGLSLTLFV